MRPRLFAAEIACSRRLIRLSSAASMRPRLFAAEIRTSDQVVDVRHHGFNEAAALRRRKSADAAKHLYFRMAPLQ